MDKNEVWAPVNGLDNYELSTLGRLRNTKTGRVLAGCINNHGYIRYDVSVRGKRMAVAGHRLVAGAFLTKSRPDDVVNHIDGDKTNNEISNLEWCSQKENMHHAIEKLGFVPNYARKRPVVCIETNQTFACSSAAGKEYGICGSAIDRCCRGIIPTAAGFHWKFSNAGIAQRPSARVL